MIFKKLLGKGTMGEVYLTQFNNSDELYATKRVEKKIVDRPQIKNFFEVEKQMLTELKHPNIIKLITTGQTQNHYTLTLEFCNGGSLLNCLKKYKEMYKKPFSEEIVQYLMRQIVEGVKCIHQHGIIQRDLKLDNILAKFHSNDDLNKLNMMKSHIKISDFGISIKADKAFTIAGSPIYTDPLILKKMNARNDLKNSDGYDKSADIWSLGALCYEMLIGHWIFNGRSRDELLKKVEIGNYTIPTYLSKEVASFLNGMLQYDPKKRLTIEQLANHDFLNKNIENFHKIDLELLGNKIKKKKLQINIKKNQTIWDALNDDTKVSTINSILHLIPYEEYEEKNKIPILIKESKFNKFRENEVKNSSQNNNQAIINSNNIKNNNNNLINHKINKNYNKSNTSNNQKPNNVNQLSNNIPLQKSNSNEINYNPKINPNQNNMKNNNINNNHIVHHNNIKNENNSNHNTFAHNSNLIYSNNSIQNSYYSNPNTHPQFYNSNLTNNSKNNGNPNTFPFPQYNYANNNYSQNAYLMQNNMIIPNNNIKQYH